MKTIFFVWMCIFVIPWVYADSFELDSPQLQMVGAKVSSLGLNNPVVTDDASAFLNNPAILSTSLSTPFSYSYKSILEEYQYHTMFSVIPLKLRHPVIYKTGLEDIQLGVFYSQMMQPNFMSTIFDDASQQIWESENFSAGFSFFGVGIGGSFYQRFLLPKISFGTVFKSLKYQVADGLSESLYSLDLGTIVTMQDFKRINYLFDQVDVAFSIRNLFASQLKFTDSGNSHFLTPDILIGLKLYLDSVNLYLHNSFEGGISVASDWHYTDTISFNGATNFSHYRLGLSLIFDGLYTFGTQSFMLGVDYAYEQNQYPYENQPNHIFTLSFLGSQRILEPIILEPAYNERLIVKQRVNIAGVGPKNSIIYVYLNDMLSKTVNTDKNGKWRVDSLFLKEGKNSIVAKAKNTNLDLSLESSPLIVYSDVTQPSFTLNLSLEGDYLDFVLDSSEQLSDIDMVFDQQKVVFQDQGFERLNPFQPQRWIARVDMPESIKAGVVPQKMSRFDINVTDLTGNVSDKKNYRVFSSLLFPKDKHVHYQSSIRVVGEASSFVKRLFVNNQPVFIGKNGQFSIPTDLKLGKNMLALKLELDGKQTLFYTCRVLRLKDFSDVDETVVGVREISFLGALGLFKNVSEAETRFFPDKFVDKGFMAQILVQSNEDYLLTDVSQDLFLDVSKQDPLAPFVQAVINNGVMAANIDGTFGLEQPLRLSDIATLLYGAGIINFTQLAGDPDSYITRKELAVILAYLPEYQEKINDLINWDTGYFIDI